MYKTLCGDPFAAVSFCLPRVLFTSRGSLGLFGTGKWVRGSGSAPLPILLVNGEPQKRRAPRAQSLIVFLRIQLLSLVPIMYIMPAPPAMYTLHNAGVYMYSLMKATGLDIIETQASVYVR